MASTKKTAVLLVNTGSPEAPTKEALAVYLKEFLSDRRVVELSPWIWQPILRGIIIPRRAEASARRYRTVWTEDGSPLVAHCKHIAEKLQTRLQGRALVRFAMCYGTHRLREVIPELCAQGVEKIVVLPLYAQYATQTTESVYDEVSRVMETKQGVEVQKLGAYFDRPLYIRALAETVRKHWEKAGHLGPKGKLLMSFHGIPQVSSDRGDPYEKQCYETAKLLATELDLTPEQWTVSFQSKFGKAKWLTPSSIDAAKEAAGSGVDRLDVICPGFSCDCLETTEEIGAELKSIYLSVAPVGKARFFYIGAINESDAAVDLYEELLKQAVA